MDLHFILQVFRVIDLKLGPQLKDLINALNGRLLISGYTPAHQFGFFLKNKTNSAGFPALCIQSGHGDRKSTKFFVNGDM